MALTIGDRHALANRIAQRVLKGNTLQQVEGEMPEGKFFHSFTEHELTKLICSEVDEFFGKEA